MDKTTEQLVSYTLGFSESELTEPVGEAALGRLFDTVAVSLAGSGSEPAQIAAKIARAYGNENGATVWGYGYKTSPDVAAQANTMMVRTYDYNDGGLSHPSDMTPGLIAAAEMVHASGREVLMGITLAYELLWGLGYGVNQSRAGFDQGLFQSVAVALAAGKLWKLDADQLAHAASLALLTNLPLRASRATGLLSMMKGCATSFAVRAGVYGAMLAKEGFTSAGEPFQGKGGLEEVLGMPVTAEMPVSKAQPPAYTRAIQMSVIKPLPAEYNVQGLLQVAPRIREFTDVDNIERIEVEIPEELVNHIADEAKFDPKTRETADHSLPYMVGVALVDGTLTLDSYTPERIADPALRPVMRKFDVRGRADYSSLRAALSHSEGVYPPHPASIRVLTKDGREFYEEIIRAKGHSMNPLTREDYNAKLDRICSAIPGLSAAQRERIREAWWNIPTTPDIREAICTLVGYRHLPA